MIQLDFQSKKPIYQQIVEQILAQVKSGELHPGDKLPTERELAAQLDIARGTVKKAYKDLADNNIIEVIQGSGSYIRGDRGGDDAETRRFALSAIDRMLDNLLMRGLSFREITMLFRMSMLRRDPHHRTVRVAIVDCNPESLTLFKRQLNYIPGVVLSVILVDTILLDDEPGRLLSGFDLVVTTATHYEQVSASLRTLDVKVMMVDMVPSVQTIMDISTLPAGGRVGIICQSNKFSNLILEQIEQHSGVRRSFPVHFEETADGCARFMRDKDVVILAPDLRLSDPALSGPVLKQYAEKGGRVITFDYLIDRTSLTCVEEQIERLLGREWW